MKNRFLTILLIAATAMTANAKPRLVVNIVVGQMRYDYLLRYGDNFSQKGFAKIIKEGVSCDRAMYNYITTSTPAGLATIATGTNPSAHGVIGPRWFDYATSKSIELAYDPTQRTVGSDDLDARVSPRSMIVSTVGDALKSLSPQSKVISLALEPASAVIMGGHSADAVYWFNPREGNMVTSSYYQSSLPSWVRKFNDAEHVQNYATIRWSTLLSSNVYKSIFKTDILTNGSGGSESRGYDYSSFGATPGANSLLRNFATQAVIGESLGRDDNTDLLNIIFDPMRLIGEKYGTQSIEIEDAYYRLDADIGLLIEFLETQIGRENLLIVVSSDHGAGDPMIESSKMPSGRFDSAQFAMLVHGFVGGLLGSGERWILDYSNNQIYFNRRLMLEKKVDIIDVQNKIAAFAIQFSGVAQAITANSLQSSYFSEGIASKAQNSYNQRHSGDVIINLLPGWSNQSPRLSDGGSPYNYDTHVPLIWYGGGVNNQNIARDVDMTDLAPTVAHLMQIAPPNASTGKPIIEIIIQ